jgi:hypothetical protein
MTTAFATWFASARPNDTFCYHVGTNLTVPREADPETLAIIRQFYNEGRIELVQRPAGPRPAAPRLSEYEHLAVKRATRTGYRPYFDLRSEALAA